MRYGVGGIKIIFTIFFCVLVIIGNGMLLLFGALEWFVRLLICALIMVELGLIHYLYQEVCEKMDMKRGRYYLYRSGDGERYALEVGGEYYLCRVIEGDENLLYLYVFGGGCREILEGVGLRDICGFIRRFKGEEIFVKYTYDEMCADEMRLIDMEGVVDKWRLGTVKYGEGSEKVFYCCFICSLEGVFEC